ncbi:MAG TPA: hypothetical protein DEB40_02140 [Elusimicrobia bacterium]|nr:hypothetical protein [Elusimicrobiota bacterium]HBT60531.1 hypothetical protein [Elusimicrobiota bacterium]
MGRSSVFSLPVDAQSFRILKPEAQAQLVLVPPASVISRPVALAEHESKRAGTASALSVLRGMESELDGVLAGELSASEGIAAAQERVWDRAADEDATEPLPQFSNPLEGIEFFRRIDAEPRLYCEEGKAGQEGYRLGQYWPRTGEFQLIKIVRDADGKVVNEVTAFNTNSGMAASPKGPAAWDQIRRDIGWVAEKLNLPRPRFRKPANYPKLRRALARMTSRPSTPAQDIKPGDFVLLGDSQLAVAQVTSVELSRSFTHGGNRVNFFSLDSSVLGGRALSFGRNFLGAYWIRYIGDNAGGYIGYADDAETKVWRLRRAEVKLLADFRPRESDPTAGTEMTRARFALLAALTALQYDRWFLDEIETETAGHKEIRERLLAGHYAGATSRNYRRALAILMRRFGEEEFLSAAAEMFRGHLRSLHTKIHTPDSPYGFHSDTAPLPVAYTEMARDAIYNVHPMPEDMSRSGYVVNVKSLFGDAEFWGFLRDAHPRLFQRLVDLLLSMPSPFPLRSIYAASTADPVAVVKTGFPKTFALIHAVRPDFESDVEPVTLLERP